MLLARGWQQVCCHLCSLLLIELLLLLLLLLLLPSRVMHVAGVADTFTPAGLRTAAGDILPADLVIYATGFDRRYDYLPADVLKDLKRTEEGIPLYRDTLPTDVEASQHTPLCTCLSPPCP